VFCLLVDFLISRTRCSFLLKEQIGNNFKFKCPNCHFKMSPYNSGGGCRLIYGEYQHFILCSPQRWICNSCAKDCQTQKRAGVLRKERLQYTWRDRDSQLLQQLSLEHPDNAEEFPCYLSKGAGVDKKLLYSIILDASKGTGLAATAKSLHQKHHHFYGSQDVKYF
jgi:hypothetical protein